MQLPVIGSRADLSTVGEASIEAGRKINGGSPSLERLRVLIQTERSRMGSIGQWRMTAMKAPGVAPARPVERRTMLTMPRITPMLNCIRRSVDTKKPDAIPVRAWSKRQ